MKVGELIKKLREFDHDLPVFLTDMDGDEQELEPHIEDIDYVSEINGVLISLGHSSDNELERLRRKR